MGGSHDELFQAVGVYHGGDPLTTTGQEDRVVPYARGIDVIGQPGPRIADGALTHTRMVSHLPAWSAVSAVLYVSGSDCCSASTRCLRPLATRSSRSDGIAWARADLAVDLIDPQVMGPAWQ